MRVDKFDRNSAGRDFVVGDIHGCYTKLKSALASIDFDRNVDRLFSVGDLVDRGDESDQVLEWLAKPWFFPVMGNHDDMAARWPAGNMQADIYARNGGEWNINQSLANQIAVSEAMKRLPIAIEVDTLNGKVGIVHADVSDAKWSDFVARIEGGGKGAQSAADSAMWSRGRITENNCDGVDGVYAVVVGHTPLRKWTVLGNVAHIDTGAVFGFAFTILNLETMGEAQARGGA